MATRTAQAMLLACLLVGSQASVLSGRQSLAVESRTLHKGNRALLQNVFNAGDGGPGGAGGPNGAAGGPGGEGGDININGPLPGPNPAPAPNPTPAPGPASPPSPSGNIFNAGNGGPGGPGGPGGNNNGNGPAGNGGPGGAGGPGGDINLNGPTPAPTPASPRPSSPSPAPSPSSPSPAPRSGPSPTPTPSPTSTATLRPIPTLGPAPTFSFVSGPIISVAPNQAPRPSFTLPPAPLPPGPIVATRLPSTFTFSANLQPLPGVSSVASGTVRGTVNRDSRTINGVLTLINVQGAREAHLHVGGSGQDGPAVAWLWATDLRQPVSQPISGSFALPFSITAADITGGLDFTALEVAIGNRGIYGHVHTTANPNGELRGQTIPDQ